MENSKILKTLKSSDCVIITFGEWFDKTYGNTYYDTHILINGQSFEIARQYGYNAGDVYSIKEALETVGYKLRKNIKNPSQSLKVVEVYVIDKKKGEQFKRNYFLN